jgi:hypothetical protein
VIILQNEESIICPYCNNPINETEIIVKKKGDEYHFQCYLIMNGLHKSMEEIQAMYEKLHTLFQSISYNDLNAKIKIGAKLQSFYWLFKVVKDDDLLNPQKW